MRQEPLRRETTAGRIEYQAADLPDGEALPRHLERRQMPVLGTGNTSRCVGALVAGAAGESGRAVIGGAALDQRAVAEAIVALARKVTCGRQSSESDVTAGAKSSCATRTVTVAAKARTSSSALFFARNASKRRARTSALPGTP